MLNTILKSSILLITLMLLTSCATTQNLRTTRSITPYFQVPPPGISLESSVLFSQALRLQKNNQLRSSFKRWVLFLRKHPRSYEALNNVGLVLYEDDQVDLAIKKFESALTLEPNDNRIRKNLVRSLNFRATMLKEGQNYPRSIKYLNRIAELSGPKEREKIEFYIERLQDRIYSQVRKTNSLQAYTDFLKRYPNSPGNAESARLQIQRIKKRLPEAVPLEVGVEGAMDSEPAVSGVVGTYSDTLPIYK
jgi:tetratricopeptide (TPR) repeat protein